MEHYQKHVGDEEDAFIEMNDGQKPRIDTTTTTASRLHPQSPTSDAQMKWLLSLRFLHPFAWFVFVCITGPLMLHLLAVNVLNHGTFDIGLDFTLAATSACDVDEVWSSWSTLFQINIRTGNLSFTAAKIIDIAFDLVVGRGGQALLAWMSYRVYTDVFTYLAERRPVPYNIFTSVTMHPTTISSLKSYTSALFSKEGLNLTLLWLIVTVSYSLAFPTLVSASTSLVGATTSAIELPNTATAPLVDYVNSAAYKFTNSGLVDKPNPWIVYTSDIHRLPEKTPDNIMYINGKTYGWFDRNDKLLVNSTTYTISNSTTIEAGFYYSGTYYPIDPTKNHGLDSLWIDQVICLPAGKRYQWGASYELLCIIVICQIIWSTAMLMVWTISCGKSATVQSGREIGLYTAILLLAEPLSRKLSEIDGGGKLLPDGDLGGEKEVRKVVKTIGRVMYADAIDASGEEEHIRRSRCYGSLKRFGSSALDEKVG